MSNAVQNKNYVLQDNTGNVTQVDLSGAYERLEEPKRQNLGLLAPVYFRDTHKPKSILEDHKIYLSFNTNSFDIEITSLFNCNLNLDANWSSTQL